MKFFTSVIVVVTILTVRDPHSLNKYKLIFFKQVQITEAYFNEELESFAMNIPIIFGETQFASSFPDADTCKEVFVSVEQQYQQSYPPELQTAGQQAAIDYVLNTKNSYKDIGDALYNKVINYKAWTSGNFSKYGDDYLSLLTFFDQKVQAGMTIVAGRPECSQMDCEMAKNAMVENVYILFDPEYTHIKVYTGYMYGMTSTYGLHDIQTALSQALYDSNPMAAILIAEKTVITPNVKFLDRQITNIGNTIISVITNTLDETVENINSVISQLINTAETYPCNGY